MVQLQLQVLLVFQLVHVRTQSANFGFQPAIDFIARSNAAKQARLDEQERQALAQQAALAEEEARKAEHRRKYAPKDEFGLPECRNPRRSTTAEYTASGNIYQCD